MNSKLSFIIILLFSLNIASQNQSFYETLGSIQELRKLSRNESLNSNDRINYAKRALSLSENTKVDTTILKSNRNLAAVYLYLDQYDDFQKVSFKILKLAKKVGDSKALAIAYNNLGWYNYVNSQNDSAFFYYKKAKKLFHNLKNEKQEEGFILFNIATIQKKYADFSNSEYSAIKSLELIKTLPENQYNLDTLWGIYNLLGLIKKKQKQYQQSNDYYKEALSFCDKLSDDSECKLFININLAELYKEQKLFNKSIKIYNKLLNDIVLINDPINYATIINNLAYVKFKAKHNDNDKIITLFNKAYKICDSLNYKYEKAASGNDLSEFYLSLGQKDSSIKYLERSYALSKTNKYNTEVLRSLYLLSKSIEGEKGKQYLYEYITLRDSLLNEEHIMQNKFARIEFETDEVVAENIKIAKDRSVLFIIACSLFIGSILLYVIYSQRLKNKQLVFESTQQKANEDIYSLMLSQQSKLEEGRINERQRISEELHDGILSKLFGIRVGIEFLLVKTKMKDALKKRFNDYINDIQSTELEIRDISHELKDGLASHKINFKNIIEHYLKTQSELHSLHYNLNSDPNISWDTINDNLKMNLYRIIQETLQNTIKHAKASHINVSFNQINKKLVLVVKDDGIGYDSKTATKGIGLSNIKSRVQNLGGEFQIESNSTNGTTITAEIPIIN
ncbi:ATP-binding protein [Pontimicrobium sp. SW4]|uniref:Oxygen sensor histidine kinase NreB n=1 Tax=Pontimicrobium sp. SW4 TaxID=3153519 RepID=A0AAU7BPB8_9FLAO